MLLLCGAGKSNLRLVDEETLLSTVGVRRGSLSYLAVMNDKVRAAPLPHLRV